MIKNLSVEFLTIVVFLVSFGITYIIIPRVIALVNYKELMDNPNDRSSHKSKTPTLGGVAFFISLIIGLFLIERFNTNHSISIIAGLTVLFVIGLKDDLMVLSAKTKFLVQIVAVTFLLDSLELLNFNFHGFLGVGSLSSWLAILLNYFVVLAIINGYNLIDGIDGLASMVGIVIFSVSFVIFYYVGSYYFALLSAIGVGFLLAFLRYNLSKNKKIFMGDTGSMIIGFVIGILLLKFLSLDDEALNSLKIKPSNAIIFSLAVLVVPFLDVLRVFVIRLMNKKKPFSPDRNHIHHILIDNGLSHFKSSLIISLVNVLIVVCIYLLNIFIPTYSLTLVFILLIMLLLLLLFRLNKNYSALKRKSKLNKVIPKKKK